MPLPKSLTQPLRQGQLTVGSGWRAYFAPFNQALAVNQSSTALGPTMYDLMVTNKFVDVPPPPTGWADLGWVDNFKFTPGSKIGNVVTGYRGAVRAKYRGEVGEKCSFRFHEMTRMAMSIATGTQVFNMLRSTATASTVGPMSSSGVAAIAMGASGYVASGAVVGYVGRPTLYVPAGSGVNFPAGSMVVCDQDYDGSSFGFVGDSGANIFQGAVTDVDFIRKTSDYVTGVSAVVSSGGQDALILTGPFVGGGNNGTLGATPTTAPTAGAKVQRVLGYGAREGGTYIKEWSAVFILDTIDASQLMFYYPRIAPDQYSGVQPNGIQNVTSIQTYDMDASFDAMAFDDPLDGETVVRYSAYYPHSGTSPAI